MRKQYDLAVKVDEYETRDGETKARWENIGVVMLNDDNKPFMLLRKTFNPSGVKNTDSKTNITVNMFPPKDRQNSRGDYPPASDNPFDDEPYYGGNGGRNDDVPF